jgi:3-phosphoshikimate 1-carboxyvinyltransferase
VIVAAVPPRKPFRGAVAVPPSKSFTNRALVLASLAAHPVAIRHPLACDDADSLIAALSAAGTRIRRDAENVLVDSGRPPSGEAVLDVRDSGTACRFLAALASATPGLRALLTGSDRLRERPIGGLVEALRAIGADVSYAQREGFPPLAIRGKELEGGRVDVAASESSQFASALLLAAPRFRRGIDLGLAGPPVSRAYLETTLEALAAAGIAASLEGGRFRVPAGASVEADVLDVPGDWSSGASLAAAVAVAGGSLRIERLPWPSTQADARALEVLQQMGVTAETEPFAVTVAGRAQSPVRVDAADFPDAVPVLSAVAARVEGESAFRGIAHLKIKESDRIAALEDLLRAAGIRCASSDDALSVTGGGRVPGPAFLPTRADHRIVMAATLLAFPAGGFVESPRSIEKSYPGFFRDVFAI